MKIFYSTSSPFVRKVMVVAHELGIADKIERMKSAVHPIRFDAGVVEHNPLGQVPTFFTDGDLVLYDSRVICEYLDDRFGRAEIFPKNSDLRWRALTDQVLADGMTSAALLIRYELTVRDEAMQNAAWVAGQRRKIEDGVRLLEATVREWRHRFDIGTIAVACSLSYLEFKLPEINWRSACPNVACWLDGVGQRPSLRKTVPVLPS